MSRIIGPVRKEADRLSTAGIVDDATLRVFEALCLPAPRDFSPDRIRTIRSCSHASQAAFAAFLNVPKARIAAWEKGTRAPGGAAARLLDLVERKGLDILK